MYRVGYDYSILVAARLAVEESDEYQEFKALNDQELNDGLSNANFEIQYISSLDKFYLVTSSEFIVPDVNNPIILEDLVAEVNQKSITYSVYLRPLEDGLHLILALSKVKMPHDAPGELPSRRNTRIICDYLLPNADLSNRFIHMKKLRDSGWKCRNYGGDETENIFGEKFISRRAYRDCRNGVFVTLIRK